MITYKDIVRIINDPDVQSVESLWVDSGLSQYYITKSHFARPEQKAQAALKDGVQTGQLMQVGEDLTYVKVRDPDEKIAQPTRKRKRNQKEETEDASTVKKQPPQYPPPRFEAGKCLWPGCGKEIKNVTKQSREAHW